MEMEPAQDHFAMLRVIFSNHSRMRELGSQILMKDNFALTAWRLCLKELLDQGLVLRCLVNKRFFRVDSYKRRNIIGIRFGVDDEIAAKYNITNLEAIVVNYASDERVEHPEYIDFVASLEKVVELIDISNEAIVNARQKMGYFDLTPEQIAELNKIERECDNYLFPPDKLPLPSQQYSNAALKLIMGKKTSPK